MAEHIQSNQAEILDLFLKYAPCGVAMFDRQMRYLMASQRWVDDYRLESVESIIGRSHYDIFPEIPESWKQTHQRCLTGTIEKYEVERFERLDGSVQWIRREVHPWYQTNQEIGGIIIFSEDITKRKQAEIALQKSQRQLQQQLAEIETIYRSAPIGLNVVDTELRFVRINQRLAEINGLPVDAHIGRTIRELLPDLADAAEQLLRPILATGEPLLNVEISGETPAQPGVQRTWLESFLPLKEGDQVIGISTVCEEITERKRIEAERQQAEEALRQIKEELESRVAKRTAELQQLNLDLQESESTLRSFFNSGGMMMAIVELHDNDIRYISANHTTAEFLGTTPKALQNRFVSEIDKSPAAVQHWLDCYRQAQLCQAPVRFEQYYDDRDRPGWFSISISPITVSISGRPRFSFIAKDVTDRKLAEAAIASREEQLRLTLEFNHIGLWDWNVRTGEIIWNDNHFRLLGLAPQSLTVSVDELYQLWLDAIHPEDVQRVEQTLLTALNQHQDYETEYRVVYPDGTIHWLVGKGRGVYDADDQPLRMLGVIIDVSDRKLAEQQLELQAVITRNMAEGICLVSADDARIVYANPKFEQMFGYEGGELNGQHVSIVNYATEIVSAEDVNQAIRSAVLAEGEATYEVHNVKKDGTPFWCSATTSVLDHPEYGRVMVAVHQDITERKQTQEQVETSLKEKEVLLKEIHHRVKNNLGIVSSLLQMQARRTLDAQAYAVLRDSQNRVHSIALVHEKLYRSKDLANINFTQYIQDLTVYLFDAYNINAQHIELSLQVEEIGLDIDTAIPCGLIINELVSNALKYAFPDGRTGEIQIKFYQAAASDLSSSEPAASSAATPSHRFTLIVRDNGIGLPADLDIQTAKTLGMMLVQGLVKQMQGLLEINNHQGTEFKISFKETKI
ncbi:MAG: PAS domain S-box protein [Thainema sp.]